MSDLCMNQKTICLLQKEKTNLTFLFTFVMENSTLTEKTSRLPAQLPHQRMIGFLCLLKFQALSLILLMQKLPIISQLITGLFGMLTESKTSELTMMSMLLNSKTYLQSLHLKNKKDNVF